MGESETKIEKDGFIQTTQPTPGIPSRSPSQLCLFYISLHFSFSPAIFLLSPIPGTCPQSRSLPEAPRGGSFQGGADVCQRADSVRKPGEEGRPTVQRPHCQDSDNGTTKPFAFGALSFHYASSTPYPMMAEALGYWCLRRFPGSKWRHGGVWGWVKWRNGECSENQGQELTTWGLQISNLDSEALLPRDLETKGEGQERSRHMGVHIVPSTYQ